MSAAEPGSNIIPPTPNASIAGPASVMPVDNQSLLGGSLTTRDSANSHNLKRKTTDPELEIITIDSMYDLTVIVGTPDHLHGQKAFQINKGSFRNASEVWTKMVSGNWAESNASEIRFPDDSCHAFLLVLQIAHLRHSELPDSLTIQELLELAILTDKYNLENTVRVGLEMKKWIDPHKGIELQWPVNIYLQDYAFITLAFKLEPDFENSSTDLRWKSCKVKLQSSLPNCIVTHVNDIRNEILREWVKCCTIALTTALKMQIPRCGKKSCALTKVGIMLKGFTDAGLYPATEDVSTMHRSVLQYWQDSKNIGLVYRPYFPYSQEHRSWRDRYAPRCNVETCFGDFGVINDAGEILKRYAHEDLWAQLKVKKFVEPKMSGDSEDEDV